MSITNVTSGYYSDSLTESAAASASSNGSDMSNLFMTLLVAQIQNQDPLNPTDGTEYVSQLAQLTQVQSMDSMSSQLANTATLVDNLQVLATGSLVGQSVMVRSGSVKLEGQPVSGRLTLDHAANTVTVHIKSADGTEKILELGKQEAGQVDFTLDPEELNLKDGSYTLSVVTDTGEESIPLEIAGTVNTVRIGTDGTPMLNIPGLGEIPYFNISQFGRQSAAATA
ncbi:flagellar hook assembly protein FlgD [Pantoea sp. BAV 3049]|uniref:flagellar hook assembly protein FlgD n=1 Tax=Pantoea sp. BAV 3049 TaxID=2654188 RepID=UPI00131CD7C5|nr:flagellar hook assembly protein FlgD [Pantoea sp. BAV 3049]